jgi:glycyl-tRNA synthetase alpha chain
VDSVYDLKWTEDVSYGDVHLQGEIEYSKYNFDEADTQMLVTLFDMYEKESAKLIEKELVLPAYDMCLKSSHVFNLLDARGAISVNERTHYIGRVRGMARASAEGYLKSREELGFPLLKDKKEGA